MAKKKKGPLIPGFPDKLAKKLPATFPDDVESMDLDEMKGSLLKSEKTIDEVEVDQSEDAKLSFAKQEVKDLSGAYRDSIAREKAKIKYILHVMKLRGYA